MSIEPFSGIRVCFFLQETIPFQHPQLNKHSENVTTGGTDRIYNLFQFNPRWKFRAVSQVSCDDLLLMELAHLDRDARKCRKQPLFAIADDTRYNTSVRDYLLYPVPIIIQCFVPHVLPEEVDLPVRIPEYRHPKIPFEVGGIHNHDCPRRINSVYDNFVVIQELFNRRMAHRIPLAKLLYCLLMVYIVLPNLAADGSGAIPPLVVEYMVTS